MPSLSFWLESPRLEYLRSRTTHAVEWELAGRVVEALIRIDARYRSNYDLPPSAQIPYVVFEKLVGKICDVVASVPSEVLYRRLRAVPEAVFGRDRVLSEVRVKLLEDVDEELQRAPSSVGALLVRGELRLDDDDEEAAARDFAEASNLDGQNPGARRANLILALRGKDDDTSLALIDAFLEMCPEDQLGLYERARLRLKHFHVAEAMRDIETLARVATVPAYRIFAASQLVAAGRPQEGARAVDEIDDDPATLLVRGRARLVLGDLVGARTALEQALGRFVDYPDDLRGELLSVLGEAWLGIGDREAALSCFLDATTYLGARYSLRRAITRMAWESLADRAEVAPNSPTRWLEANMEARFVEGAPVEIRSSDLESAPYLERFPWHRVVESLELGFGRRDNREALLHLFSLNLPRLRHLDIQAEHFGYPCLARLIEAPFYAQLETLALRECDLSEPAMVLLFENLPTDLRTLCVTSGDAQPRLSREKNLQDALRRLEGSKLETLEISSCGLRAAEVMAIVNAALPKLEKLVLTGNDLGKLDPDALLDCEVVRQLIELRLGDAGLSASFVESVLSRLDQLALRRLWAQRDWSEQELGRILEHPGARQLEQLELGVSQIPEGQWLALLDDTLVP